MAKTYGSDKQCEKTSMKVGTSTLTLWSKYFVSPYYEKDVTSTSARHLHYIYGATGIVAILVRTSGADPGKMYYVHKDHLGSYDVIVDEDKNRVDSLHFDAWGNRKQYANWTQNDTRTNFRFDRGFTGHEHLDNFKIINMNGRLYDPVIGRFFSPDPYVQLAGFTQNYNRYSYCLNNPLHYTDPDGEWFWLIPVAIAGTINLVENFDNVKEAWNDNAWKGIGKGLGFFAIGAGQGAISYFGGPWGSAGANFAGSILNTTLRGNGFEDFKITEALGRSLASIAVAPLSNVAGNFAGKLFRNVGNGLVENIVGSMVNENINYLTSGILFNSMNEQDIGKGFKQGWAEYGKGGGWWKASLTGLGDGIVGQYDIRKQYVEEYKKELAKKDSDLRKDFMKNLKSDVYLNGWQRFAIIQYRISITIYIDIYLYTDGASPEPARPVPVSPTHHPENKSRTGKP
ncbi:hypothetical protein LJC68_02090 [Bacteroidales bacterium OttesenSCG-928-B11]|nr:hypothetical protein [Bacteroidales bacterium OttesenSCG-928-C03]MDL2311651.1 hypothetical protein [Bacteroidales bacterium OttesenSCG-928-B11]